MAASPTVLPLEDLVLALYCALDDALGKAGVAVDRGRLVPRRGPPPEVDDREVLCLAVLQELLGFDSDHSFHVWSTHEPTLRSLFPRRLTRQNFSDRRMLLTPLLERLCSAFCDIAGEGRPPFSSSTVIPWKFVSRCAPAAAARSAWTA